MRIKLLGRVIAICMGFGLGLGLAYAFLYVQTGGIVSACPLFRTFRNDPVILESSLKRTLNRTVSREGNGRPEDVRVLCWVLTGPRNHEKAMGVKQTWGRRCDKLLFMSSEEDPSLPSIALPNLGEGRGFLWAKTKEAFKYVYEHHLEDADWFMKADDDAYVIVDNLRYMLKDYNSEYPIYFGARFHHFVKQGYMSGGPGYVLSKEALKRFVEMALPNIDDYEIFGKTHEKFEDVGMGICMQSVGVEAGDSRDKMGLHRFLPILLDHHIVPGRKDWWYWLYLFYSQKKGMDCCSDIAISFHYVDPIEMYVRDYLIYHLRPYGISSDFHDQTAIEGPNNETHTK